MGSEMCIRDRVFLRSLWLHIRIFWDKDPGRGFKWGSIIFGTAMPLVCLIAVLSVTGLSYRMGQTCLPNHEHAIVTFWIWLVIFASLAFLLQTFTSGYCFYVYVRSLRRVRRESAIDSSERGQVMRKLESWGNVKNLFLLQWRNVLVSIFVIVGSISFFIVFWTQDNKLGRVFNDPKNIQTVKIWIICQILSMGDKQECRKYVQDFTVDQAAVLVSLILASVSSYMPSLYAAARVNLSDESESLSEYRSSSSSSAPPWSRPGFCFSDASTTAHFTEAVRPPLNSPPSMMPTNTSSALDVDSPRYLVTTSRPIRNLLKSVTSIQQSSHRPQGPSST